jgi:RHS repeat-associated protein
VQTNVYFDDFRIVRHTGIEQSNDYYAFGKVISPLSFDKTSVKNNFLYNGKELQEGLDDVYDYGARMYMSDIGRWGVIDPLSELMRRHSPYNYAYNNPIRFIDPDGMRPRSSINPNGSGGQDEEEDNSSIEYTKAKLRSYRKGQPHHTRVLTSPVGGNVAPSSGYKAVRNVKTPEGKGSSPHRGIDYPVPVGTPVQAIASGTIVRSGYSKGGYGNVVVIDHGKAKDSEKRVYTLYAHNSELKVNVGDIVEVGTEIALSGNTGKSTGPHVHLGAYMTNDDPNSDAFYSNVNNDYDPTKLGNLLLGQGLRNDSNRSENLDPLMRLYFEMQQTDNPNKRQMLMEIFIEIVQQSNN